MSPATRQHLNAYADGVNDYIGRADSPSDMGLEYVVLGQQYPGYTVVVGRRLAAQLQGDGLGPRRQLRR